MTHMVMTMFRYTLRVTLLVLISLTSACNDPPQPLTVYAGKGLKYALDEIARDFESEQGVHVEVIYAGSHTLYDVIRTTKRGDVFIPGSTHYLDKAGNLIASREFVAWHVPTFAATESSTSYLKDYHDLLKPGVRIAVGNERMAAIGRVGRAMLDSQKGDESFEPNIVVSASSVSELLQLLQRGEVDAALVWKDMLQWPASEGLREVKIPDAINKPKEIAVAVLSTTQNPVYAKRFSEYVATYGRDVFIRHGFVR